MRSLLCLTVGLLPVALAVPGFHYRGSEATVNARPRGCLTQSKVDRIMGYFVRSFVGEPELIPKWTTKDIQVIDTAVNRNSPEPTVRNQTEMVALAEGYATGGGRYSDARLEPLRVVWDSSTIVVYYNFSGTVSDFAAQNSEIEPAPVAGSRWSKRGIDILEVECPSGLVKRSLEVADLVHYWRGIGLDPNNYA